ncbi:hypothetical protein ACS0TY_033185 [Phlomoides rotata]
MDENCMSKPADPKRDAMPRALTDFSGSGDKGSGSSNENRQLNEIMKGIDGLKVSDKLKVCDELVHNSKRLEFFLRLPAEEQEEYVWMLLDDCRDQLRMDRAAFHKLCFILQTVCGLKSSRRVGVPEKIAMFLSILAHHTKNRCVKFAFKRVLRLHVMFLVKPQPISDDDTNPHCAGNPMGHDGDRAKSVRGRRSWSKIEEDVLVLCLTNIVIEGWKSENEFKAGFLRELEKAMRKIIPQTDLLATPHINSKIHVWKKEYGALSDLLSKSGIGWNSTTSMIEIEDESVWDSCRRADPHVKGIRYKT